MAKKGTKATRKFAASGQLTKKIQARRKHQQIQKKIQKNTGAKNKGRERSRVDVGGNEGERTEETKSSKKTCVISCLLSVDGALHVSFWYYSLKGMSVDDFLGASFMEEDEDVSLSWIPPVNRNVMYAPF